ncbi:MAG TPA: aromatic acid exporter family protein, partial [Streptosporangiaceae bacterium]|nr:aromatic acid exporter family protein [Streptosporangiaceae bacterium]
MQHVGGLPASCSARVGFMLPPWPAHAAVRIPRPASNGIADLADRRMRADGRSRQYPGREAREHRPGACAVSLAIRPRHRAAEISTAARSITQRAPVTLTLVRHRAQPTAATIVRLTVTAVFAYLLALLLPNASRPVMAPLTALLVVQVGIYQTLRTAARRVASVVAGVLLALGLSAWVGFTWWSLGITIALGLTVGYALHLREEVLEVPISAMLIMSVGTRSAATGRI